MKEILHELNSGNSVIIESSDLPKFWEYVRCQKDYYSFRYSYSESLVTITLIEVKEKELKTEENGKD